MKKTKITKLAQTLTVGCAVLAFSATSFAGDRLQAALDAQPEEAKARYDQRNPKETLKFFGLKEGMTVMEALPGGGWYSKILLPSLGEDGKLIGVDYAQDMWGLFGFMTPERIEEKKTWVETWTADANGWRSEGDASVSAFKFTEMPEDYAGTADMVLYVRALHNLFRFEEKGGYLSSALKETNKILKPGGFVGVVQHEALADRPDSWADGSNGYLKKSAVIAAFEANGFELVGESDINSNPKDQANEGDFVWRLPPTLFGTKDDEAKKQAAMEIGESNRMTLLFKKS